MLGLKNLCCARLLLSGIEVTNLIRKGETKDDGVARITAQAFYSLVM
jgi:hypothetical protein